MPGAAAAHFGEHRKGGGMALLSDNGGLGDLGDLLSSLLEAVGELLEDLLSED